VPAALPDRADRRSLAIGNANVGGLVSYGADIAASYPHAAEYVDRILRGQKPSDLPVQQPTKFILTFNLRTARVIGLESDVPCRSAECLLLAQSGHAYVTARCLLLAEKWTSVGLRAMSAYDPKQTLDCTRYPDQNRRFKKLHRGRISARRRPAKARQRRKRIEDFFRHVGLHVC
jgi:hypothetical protein